MFAPKIRFLIVLAFVFFVKTEIACAQQRGNPADTAIIITPETDIDALFKLAKESSQPGDNGYARKVCFAILEKFPDNYEVRTFLGRTYAWDKDYDNARTQFSTVLIEKPDDIESLSALIDVETWTENYTVANEYLKTALGFYPNSEDLLLKKAKLLVRQNDKQGAALTLRRILDLNPGNADAQSLISSLKVIKYANYVQGMYSMDFFDDTTKNPQKIASFEYGRNFKFATLIGRFSFVNKNYGPHMANVGYQYEMDAYVHLAKGTYVYLNGGYSKERVLPKYRCAADVYQKIPAGFELSVGFRYLEFVKPAPSIATEATAIYTGYIGNYFRNYWFSLRAFVTPGGSDLSSPQFKNSSQTYIFSTRYYFGDADNFAGIHFGSGQSPDSRNTYSSVNLKALQGGLELQRRIFRRWTLKGEGGYSHEETRADVFQQRLTVALTLKDIF